MRYKPVVKTGAFIKAEKWPQQFIAIFVFFLSGKIMIRINYPCIIKIKRKLMGACTPPSRTFIIKNPRQFFLAGMECNLYRLCYTVPHYIVILTKLAGPAVFLIPFPCAARSTLPIMAAKNGPAVPTTTGFVQGVPSKCCERPSGVTRCQKG